MLAAVHLAHRIAGKLRRCAAPLSRDEIVSSMWPRLVVAVRAYDPTRGVPFEAYLAPLLVGSVLHERRRRQRWNREEAFCGGRDDLPTTQDDVVETPEDLGIARDRRQIAASLLERLRPEARLVLQLWYEEERSWEEIAVALNTTPGGARRRRDYAISQLRAMSLRAHRER
jgi:RNA polymerase sigma factor (sigma-70 family)